MKPITLWSKKIKKQDETEVWEFNHIENGHVIIDQKLPTPICEIHKTLWKNGQWKFIHTHLSDDFPVPKVLKD